MEIAIIVALIVIAIFMGILEVFFIPGFGIAGIAGIIFGSGAVWYTYDAFGTAGATITGIAGIIGFVATFVYFLKSKTWNKIGLQTNIESKVETQIQKVKVGDKGITISRLAPMGQVLVNGVTIEAKSEDELIDEEETIIITAVHSSNATVRKIKI